MADVKGDLTAIAQLASIGRSWRAALAERGLPQPVLPACPATLWYVLGERGHPVWATVVPIEAWQRARAVSDNP